MRRPSRAAQRRPASRDMLPASRSARLAALGLLATVAAAAAVFLLRAPDSGAGGALGAPLLVLGLITDAQYADIPDAVSAWKVPRCYRYSIEVVRAAVAAWAAVAPSDGGVSAVVHLGDAVDGNAGQGPGGAIGALDVVSAAFAALGRPVHYLLGNHGFYSFDRPALYSAYGIEPAPSSGGAAYRSVSPAPGVRLLLLDTYAVSTIGWPAGDARHEAAKALLDAGNPGRKPGASLNDPSGLVGTARRWVALGGALGAPQLAWLEAELSAAAAVGERVLVFSHVALHAGATSAWCGGLCLGWDYEEALAVLRRHAGTVAACFAGHDHFGATARDDASGIAFITLPGVIETRRGDVAFAELALYERALRLAGHGRVRSRIIPLPPLPPAAETVRRTA